jgi:hypothetical protein
MRNQDGINQLCTWINQIVASSRLESLEIFWEYAQRDISFSELISPLAQQHAGTLRFLHLHQSFLEPHSMRVLCDHFVNLEELSVIMDGSALVRI